MTDTDPTPATGPAPAEHVDASASARPEHLAIAALALVSFATALNAQVIAALGPYLRDLFGAGALGPLIAVNGLAATAAALMLGPLVDRVGRRAPLLAGAIVFAAGSLLHPLADAYAVHVALRGVTGFAGGLVFLCASSALADIVPYRRRGFAMGVLTGVVFLALPVGLPLAVAFARGGMWAGVFAVQAVVAAVAVPVLLRVVPAGVPVAVAVPRATATIREPGVAAALLSVALYTGGFFTAAQFAGVWLDDSGLLDRASQGWLWAVMGVTSAAGAVTLTRLADRVGKRAFVLWTTMLVAVALLLLGRVRSMMPLVAVGVPLAAVAAARSGAMMALVSALVPRERRATLMGLRSAAVYLGMGVVPWIGDALYRGPGYAALAGACAAAVAAAYLLVRLFVREAE